MTVTARSEIPAALNTDVILGLTGKLVAPPKVNPRRQEAACARVIHDPLTEWGIEMARYPLLCLSGGGLGLGGGARAKAPGFVSLPIWRPPRR